MLLIKIISNMKVMEIKTKRYQFKEQLDEIKPYLNDLIDNHKTKGEWKIQLIMAVNFIFSKDFN